ncbi:MAG: hypothetical protein M1832_001251 [Thelocarpon impressellum]|nr:MAG: hypothetical protein M1832_001251 [Thelocarpon impressellum]
MNLVSPSSANFLSPSPSQTPAPTSLSTQATVSAQATHLQDLQHKVSIKKLALQTLQQEHDRILTALSRLQSQCGTLEKMRQANKNKIGQLSKERMKLQTQVNALQAQIKELMESRDKAYVQSAARAARAANNKQWNAEKAKWAETRVEITRRLEELQAVTAAHRKDAPTHRSPSIEALRTELAQLRKGYCPLKGTLQELNGIGQRIEQVIGRLGNNASVFNQAPSSSNGG